LTVFATDTSLAERICQVVASADPVLTACGLPTDYGPLTLYVVGRIDGAQAHCLGAYVCETNEVAVLDPTVLGNAESPETEFDAISPQALFDSLVVHELTHSRLSHLPEGGDIGVVNQEYIAYAMQLASLPAQEREAFLIGYLDRELDIAAINVFTLGLAPGYFASLAWRHFDQTDNGCAFVQSLMDQDFTFERPFD
jgi:hypothetical protein